MTKQRILALSRLAAAIVTGVLTIMAALGYNPIPITSDQVSFAVFGVLTLASQIWMWWKNNNMSAAAQTGQDIITRAKMQGLSEALGTTIDEIATTPQEQMHPTEEQTRVIAKHARHAAEQVQAIRQNPADPTTLQTALAGLEDDYKTTGATFSSLMQG